MSARRKLLVRVVAATIVIAITGLVAEGAASVFLGRSLLRWLTGQPDGSREPVRMRMFDEERLRAAALSEGPYAGDLDALVSIKLKGAFSPTFNDVRSSTDSRGIRNRVGPEPEPRAQRIVVLGDSVAFGYGLKDDETIAHHLERFLAGAIATKELRPVTMTVACPGWSLMNSHRFLLDHLDDIKPDVVLLITVQNDLDDSYAIIESGHRTQDYDPARGIEFPVCTLTYHSELVALRQKLHPFASKGLYALYGAVTPESRRRYRAAAAGIIDLGARLAAAGSKLALVMGMAGEYEFRLAESLAAQGSPVPILVLVDAASPEDAQVGDPHPNARFAKAISWRLAQFLARQHWVPDAREEALPPEDERYARRIGNLPDPAEILRLRARFEQSAMAELGPRIDFTDGTAWHQIYGGIWPDGVIGNAAWVALRAGGGSRLVVKIRRLPDHPGLHPMHVRLIGNHANLGTIDLARPAPGDDGVVESSFDFPAGLLESGILDVRLVPSEWIVDGASGVSRLAAFKLESIAVK